MFVARLNGIHRTPCSQRENSLDKENAKIKFDNVISCSLHWRYGEKQWKRNCSNDSQFVKMCGWKEEKMAVRASLVTAITIGMEFQERKNEKNHENCLHKIQT